MEVTFEQFSIIAARVAALEDMMKMLLTREIEHESDIGLFWQKRASIARADMADQNKWSDITPSPIRMMLQEMVAIVGEAEELAGADRKREDFSGY